LNPKIFAVGAWERIKNPSDSKNPFHNLTLMDYPKAMQEAKRDFRVMGLLLRPEIVSVIAGKAFFVSADNYVGLCTIHAKPMDLIVVLDGMEVPLILRKSGDGGHYTVIGEACKSSCKGCCASLVPHISGRNMC
jgi:hypothetical protein